MAAAVPVPLKEGTDVGAPEDSQQDTERATY